MVNPRSAIAEMIKPKRKSENDPVPEDDESKEQPLFSPLDNLIKKPLQA